MWEEEEQKEEKEEEEGVEEGGRDVDTLIPEAKQRNCFKERKVSMSEAAERSGGER